jgi:UDP-N-acetylglucosamine--N-acetylmuramyl-(pentapeptide) pyrophosphoryl-undecaprenol N-acetylglucosamine transferase
MKDIVFLCAGGTGGHMFPAMALAHDLKTRGTGVVFVTDKRGEKFIKPDDGIEVKVISSATLPKGLWGKVKGLYSLGRGYMQSRSLIKKYNPKIVVGFGGYPSLPPMKEAQAAEIPTIIHEQNAVLGKANAHLAAKAERIALSLSDYSSLDESDAIRAIITGNPVRADIAALYSTPYHVPDNDGPFYVVVMGGSLGAKVMGDIVPSALSTMPDELRSRVSVIQQCHADSIGDVSKVYKDAGIQADIRPFIDDMPAVLKAAHLVIARSGASTVAEVSIAGVPAIYVPYPHHADMQQKVNAQTISTRGGAWVMMEGDEFTPAKLSQKIESLMLNPEELFNAAEAARGCAKPEAARKLGNLVVALIKGWDKSGSRPFDYNQGNRG